MKHKPRAGAIVPYFGSKRRIADTIVAEFGPHRCFWDCAHGGLSVLFAKKRSTEETVLDLNGHATNLAMVLASPRYKELYDLCARTIPAEGIYRDCCTRFRQVCELPPESPAAVTLGDVARAYDFFIASWLGRQGVGGTHRSNYQIPPSVYKPSAVQRGPIEASEQAPRQKPLLAATFPRWTALLNSVR